MAQGMFGVGTILIFAVAVGALSGGSKKKRRRRRIVTDRPQTGWDVLVTDDTGFSTTLQECNVQECVGLAEVIQNEVSPEPVPDMPGWFHIYVEAERQGSFPTLNLALVTLQSRGILLV